MPSSLKCPSCNKSLSRYSTRALHTDHLIQCQSCKMYVDPNNVKVETLPSSLKFGDSNYTKKSAWWHGTMSEGWGKWIDSYPTYSNVHIGTYGAALSRRSSFLDARPWHIFKVRLKDHVVVSNTIESDAYHNAVETDEGVAQRYLNIWEAPGSISLAVCKGDLEVIEHRVLQPGKWTATVLEK